MSAASWIGPAIIAAVISAVVTGFGWVISERQSVRRDAARRRERIGDVQTALLAEIRAGRHRIGDLSEMARAVDHAFSERADYRPFVTRPVPTFVLDAILADIHLLPISVIDPVVLHYRQAAAVALFVDDLRSETFEKLDVTQKRAMYRDYVDLLIYSDVLAGRAIDTLGRSLNISDAGPSDRRSDEGRGGVSEEMPWQGPDEAPAAVDAERSGDRSS